VLTPNIGTAQAITLVGCQKSATDLDLGIYAARSYSLMRPPPVVVGRVLVQDGPQMPLAEDQHLVGDVGPGGEYEPLRIIVRPRAPRRDLHHLDPRICQHRVNAAVNCPARSRTRNRKSAALSPRSISRLGIYAVQGPSGFAVTPRMCT
jgi:hypothetical protein